MPKSIHYYNTLVYSRLHKNRDLKVSVSEQLNVRFRTPGHRESVKVISILYHISVVSMVGMKYIGK